MIKKLLFSLMFFALLCLQVTNAQVCQPDPQYTQPGIYPDSATGLPCAIFGSLYEVVMTFIVPSDTMDPTCTAAGGTSLTVDSVALTGMVGLPDGMAYQCDVPSCSWVGGSTGCNLIIGNPTINDTTYGIKAYTTAYATCCGIPIIGCISVSQQDTIDFYSITVANDLVLDTTSITNITTCGVSNGAIDLSVTGGTSSYTYSWNTIPTQTTQDITGLTAGTYTVTVTDGCFSKTLTAVVSDPGNIIIDTVSVTHVSVFGGNGGAINITVTGGAPPYTFSWTGPGGPYSTEDLDTLLAGTYVITATDTNNCSKSLSIVISQPSGISEINAQSFGIVQNRPNPFTDKTEIIFTSPNAADVEFKVYNVLGKVVYSQNVKAKAGANTVEFFTNDLPAGIYLYGLSDDKHRAMRKMIIN